MWICQFEEDLGVELFLCDGKCMSLIECGSEFFVYVEQLLVFVDEVCQLMYFVEFGGCLCLGSMESIVVSCLLVLLVSYYKVCLWVVLEVFIGISCVLFDGVWVWCLDCVLVVVGLGWVGEFDGSGLCGELLFCEELLMILLVEYLLVYDVVEVCLCILVGFVCGCIYW